MSDVIISLCDVIIIVSVAISLHWHELYIWCSIHHKHMQFVDEPKMYVHFSLNEAIIMCNDYLF